MLIIMQDRNIQFGVEDIFDLEAFRGLDVLQVDTPESGADGYNRLDQLQTTLTRLLNQAGDGLAAIVVIDNEAGMEHLSRRTTRDVNHLLVVTDLISAAQAAMGGVDIEDDGDAEPMEIICYRGI